MLERFGIPVGDETLRKAVEEIQNGTAKFVRRSTLRVSLFELTIHNILVQVAYDKRTKEIITIYRPGEADL